MEHRALLAVILSIAILIGYQVLFVNPQIEKTDQQQASKTIAQEKTKVTTNQETPHTKQDDLQSNISNVPLKLDSYQNLPSSPTVKEEIIKEIQVSTDIFEAVLSTKGGKIKSLRLRKYLDDDQKFPIEMVKNGGSLEFTPIDFYDSYRNIIYTVDRESLKLSGKQKGKIIFTAETSGNLIFEKIFSFQGDRYDIEFKFDVSNISKDNIKSRFGITWQEHYSKERLNQGYAFVGPAIYIDDKRKEIKPKDIEGKSEFSGDIGWIGFEDKYFINGLIPTENKPDKIWLKRLNENLFSADMVYPQMDLFPGATVSYKGKVYLGPKLAHNLALVPNNFDKALNYGWFDIIARPLLVVLKWFEKYTSNWGIAIIVLTILIKIIFYPLTHKSYKSMKEMQKIQPKMMKLREKYKDDKEKLNREMWHLYKTHKVNPLGGCLPMLLQIPVFFALYRALLYSIELRHSPFIPNLPLLDYRWITDLSAKDPLYITPLIMGASMFIQQKMTPSTADPNQAKFMLLMPVIFTVMFLNFPSGLVIYWLVNNILSIGQQFYINKYTS